MIVLITIDPTNNTERENYKLLIGSIIPRPIAFITSQSNDDILNGAPFSYFNIVSSNPPMVSIAIQHSSSGRKDTTKNILTSGEFVVHIVDEGNVEKINQTAATLPRQKSEISLANLTPINSVTLDVPGIKEAKIRMECVLEHSIELGDSHSPSSDLIIGKVVQFHIDPSIYRQGRIDPRGLGAISRLAGHDYAKIGDIFTIERPN